jgi:hypothetical protein
MQHENAEADATVADPTAEPASEGDAPVCSS